MSNALQTKSAPDKRERITKRLKTALDLMIWPNGKGQSLDYVEAGKAVNISANSMRRALDRPAVRMYLRTEREVFRESQSTKILSRLGELAMQDENKNAAVAGCKAFLDQDNQARPTHPHSSPWLTINLVTAPSLPVQTTIEHSHPIEPVERIAPGAEPDRFDDQGHPQPRFKWPPD